MGFGPWERFPREWRLRSNRSRTGPCILHPQLSTNMGAPHPEPPRTGLRPWGGGRSAFGDVGQHEPQQNSVILSEFPSANESKDLLLPFAQSKSNGGLRLLFPPKHDPFFLRRQEPPATHRAETTDNPKVFCNKGTASAGPQPSQKDRGASAPEGRSFSFLRPESTGDLPLLPRRNTIPFFEEARTASCPHIAGKFPTSRLPGMNPFLDERLGDLY